MKSCTGFFIKSLHYVSIECSERGVTELLSHLRKCRIGHKRYRMVMEECVECILERAHSFAKNSDDHGFKGEHSTPRERRRRKSVSFYELVTSQQSSEILNDLFFNILKEQLH